MAEQDPAPPEPMSGKAGQYARAGMQVAGGAIPFAGGLLSAIASLWGEREQARAYEFLKYCIQMMEGELREKQQTMLEIIARVDIHDEEISKRIKSEEYQSLLKKAFREWGATESEKKRVYIRNILSNAASTRVTSDDVVRLFLDWISRFSEFHFVVIGAIYNEEGISRSHVWRKIGKSEVREDSADADLYKLLFQDLSMGHIIRQSRETDVDGRFLKQQRQGNRRAGNDPYMKSAFDDEKEYVLTDLGRQFVHYAMTELTLKVQYQSTAPSPSSEPNATTESQPPPAAG